LKNYIKKVITSCYISSQFAQGKCRSIGVSNFTVGHLKLLIEDPDTTVVPAVNQVELHPKLTQLELRKYCKEKGIQIEAYSSLVKGEVQIKLVFVGQTKLFLHR
jgi:diketogulonate reductase-like aldo/keto reductase